MTTDLHPLRSKFQTVCSRCKQKWHNLQERIQRLLSPLTQDEAEPWPPLDELTLAPIEEGTSMAAAHLTLDDTHGIVENHKMVVVEVKYFPKDLYQSDKRESEDPYTRVTHYPPSNRLH